MAKKTFAFVAGRSGGHLLPALTIAKKLKTEGVHIIFFCSNTAIDTKIINDTDTIDQKVILTLDNIPRRPWLLPLFLLHFIKSFALCIKIFKKNRPEKVISTGGYVSIPVCLAARLLGIHFEIYELNAIPGKAIIWLSRFATHINVCFKQTVAYFPQSKANLVNYPLIYDSVNNQKSLTIPIGKKVIFILGGSQGSQFINNLIINWYKENQDLLQNIYAIHQTGIDHIEMVKKEYKKLNINAHVFGYEPDLAAYYNAADLVIARAGAGSLFEIVFFKKKCIIIPLETKNTDHQLFNAQIMQKEYPELITIIRQSDCINSSILDSVIKSLFYTQEGQLDGLPPKLNA